MTKYEIGKTYKTRGGYDAEIYAIKEGQDHPLVGAYLHSGVWHPRSWSAGGFEVNADYSSQIDLLPPAPEKVKVWVALSRDNNGHIYSVSSVKGSDHVNGFFGNFTISGIECIEIEVSDDSGK